MRPFPMFNLSSIFNHEVPHFSNDLLMNERMMNRRYYVNYCESLWGTFITFPIYVHFHIALIWKWKCLRHPLIDSMKRVYKHSELVIITIATIKWMKRKNIWRSIEIFVTDRTYAPINITCVFVQPGAKFSQISFNPYTWIVLIQKSHCSIWFKVNHDYDNVDGNHLERTMYQSLYNLKLYFGTEHDII